MLKGMSGRGCKGRLAWAATISDPDMFFVFEIYAGGKPSSWFPPERLVKLAVDPAAAYKIYDRYLRENRRPS